MPGESLVRFVLDRFPESPPFSRADLYRRLTRNIHRDILETAFPRFLSVFGSSALESMMDAFLDSSAPQTLQYPRLPDDLVHWARQTDQPSADLLDYERAAVRAERHPAELDSLHAPGPNGLGRLNPTLDVCVCERSVHEISAAHPEPTQSGGAVVYLSWRRPRTDEVARHRVGIHLGRALGLLGLEPLTPAVWVDQAIQRAPSQLEPDAFRVALLAMHESIRQREGILAPDSV